MKKQEPSLVDSGQKGKRPYTSPEFKKYGKVTDITLGGGSSDSDVGSYSLSFTTQET